jgi:hypothetical protein
MDTCLATRKERDQSPHILDSGSPPTAAKHTSTQQQSDKCNNHVCLNDLIEKREFSSELRHKDG